MHQTCECRDLNEATKAGRGAAIDIDVATTDTNRFGMKNSLNNLHGSSVHYGSCVLGRENPVRCCILVDARWVYNEPAGSAADVENHAYAVGLVMT